MKSSKTAHKPAADQRGAEPAGSSAISLTPPASGIAFVDAWAAPMAEGEGSRGPLQLRSKREGKPPDDGAAARVGEDGVFAAIEAIHTVLTQFLADDRARSEDASGIPPECIGPRKVVSDASGGHEHSRGAGERHEHRDSAAKPAGKPAIQAKKKAKSGSPGDRELVGDHCRAHESGKKKAGKQKVQRLGREPGDDPRAVHAAAELGLRGEAQTLPHLAAIQAAFGRHDVTGIRAHCDERAARASGAMGAVAYATGEHVAFAGWPSLHTAAHEAAHVVQQRAGVHLKGGVGERDDVHERHADAVADLVVQGRSAGPLLDRYAGAAATREDVSGTGELQRKEASGPDAAAPSAAPAPASSARTSPAPDRGEVAYFTLVAGPLWRGQLEVLAEAQRGYWHHLLAVRCLQIAKGPGADPVGLAEFVRTWRRVLTAPVVGVKGLLQKVVELALGEKSAVPFDPTGVINAGFNIIAKMAPLLGAIQLRNAALVALDESVVAPGDQTAVGELLLASVSIHELFARVEQARKRLEDDWAATLAFARRVELKRQALGLPETVLE